MEKHVTLLGAFYIGLGIMDFLVGTVLFVVLVGGGIISGDTEALRVTSIVGTVLGLFFFIWAVPEVICGLGLLRRQAWSRIFGLVLSFLNLLGIPLGTVVGVYGIWVLMKDETAAVFGIPVAHPQPSSESGAPSTEC